MHLAKRALVGDPAAVEWLVERLSRIPAFVRAKNARMGSSLSHEEVADVVQESLTAIWAKLDTFEGRSSFDTWTCGFAVHEVHKAIDRKYGARRFASSETLDVAPDPVEPPEEPTLDPRVVHEALERLGPPASDVIRMRHFDELPFDAIADRMGTGENTIKARYYRGLVRLKELLGAEWRKAVS